MPARNAIAAALWCCASLGGAAVARAQSAPRSNPYNGAYVGLELGGEFGSSRKDFTLGATTGDFPVSGVVGGADAGYNWAFGKLVIGLEGDLSGSGVSGTAHAPNPAFTYKTNPHWLGTLHPRLGYLLGSSTVPYVTGGLAFGDLQVRSFRTATGAEGVDDTRLERDGASGQAWRRACSLQDGESRLSICM